MKKPLNYQNTEYDSLTITIINALKYVLDKKTIPSEVLNSVFEKTNGKEIPNIRDLISLLNECNIMNNLEVKFDKPSLGDLNEECILNITKNGGAIIAKCYGNQYVLVTGIDEFNTYLFDPYYLDVDFLKDDEEYKIICDEPFKYNRIVHNTRFFSCEDKSYALADLKDCIIVESNEKTEL